MAWDLLIGCLIIVIARIADVSLGTIRTIAVVSGHRGMAWVFGFLEVSIWVFVVAEVITHIGTEPAYGIAFALGAATGNYIGVSLQGLLPFGDQVIRVFTRKGEELCEELRRRKYRVTRFEGVGRDSAVTMLFVQVRRSRTVQVVRAARSVDPACFYTIDDIRVADTAAIARPSLTTATPPRCGHRG